MEEADENNNNTKSADDRMELGLHQSLMLAIETAYNHLLGIQKEEFLKHFLIHLIHRGYWSNIIIIQWERKYVSLNAKARRISKRSFYVSDYNIMFPLISFLAEAYILMIIL